MIGLALCLLLAAPPTLGDALRAVGAFDQIDHTLIPPPPPAQLGAKTLVATGALLVVSGLIGMVFSPHCATKNALGECVDARGSDPIYPSLVVLGLGTTISGSFWLRQDLP